MKSEFILDVGGLKLAVQCSPEQLGRELENRYQEFVSSGQPDWRVSLGWLAQEEAPAFLYADPLFEGSKVIFRTPNYQGEINTGSGEASLRYKSRLVLEEAEYFLRVIYALLAFKEGGLLFHAAGIRRDSGGYAFFGLSGSGKTTVAQNSPDGSVLNDDLLLFRRGESGWRMYATPFWNPSQVAPSANHAPLTALLRLVQAKMVKLESMSGAAALAELLASVPVVNQNPALTSTLLQRLGRLLEEVPVYRLYFLPDESFWRVVLPLGDDPQ